MRIALCNEVIAAMPFDRQCAYAAKLGYAGLEVAPYTLAQDPTQIGSADAQRHARIAADHGMHLDEDTEWRGATMSSLDELLPLLPASPRE